MCLFLRPYQVFPILSIFSLSYLCSCWLGYLSHHPRLFFFSTQRERKLNGSSLIVALVSLFSFLKATKCIPCLDVSTVSIVSQLQLLYESTRLRLARTRFRDWSVKITLQIPDHIISKDSTRYSKRSAWRCFWLLQSLFCLRRFCPGVFVFIYIIYMNESKFWRLYFKCGMEIYI